MKRAFDLAAGLAASLALAVPMLVIALLVKLTSEGPVLYWSDRVGLKNKLFKMPKFRTMRIDTPEVATHLLKKPGRFLTPIGHWLRVASLDELPQLYNILRGELSFVGPRPALYNQDDLIKLRTQKGIHTLMPGLTGWAQVNGRDDIPIPKKVEFDEFYLKNMSFFFDLEILAVTAIKVVRAEGVKH